MTLINHLNSSNSIEELNSLIMTAISDKSVFKWNIPDDFNLIFDKILEFASTDNILLIMSIFGRLEAVTQKQLFDLISAAKLITTAPQLSQLKSADDKYYSIQFIKQLPTTWGYSWYLENLWSEATAEKARFALLQSAYESSKNLYILLKDVTDYGKRYIKSNITDSQKVTGKSLRIIKTLRELLKQNEIECGLDIGSKLDDFIESLFSHFTLNQLKNSFRGVLVPEIIGLLLDFISIRFSLAMENAHYKPLKRIRKWFNDQEWKTVCLDCNQTEKLANIIAEAILILCRQQVKDGELLERLRDITSSEDNFRFYCKKITETDYIDENLKEWLLAGGKRIPDKKTISSNQQLVNRSELSNIGELLLQANEANYKFKSINNYLDDLELFDPNIYSILKDILNQWKIVCDLVEKSASYQSIRLIGEQNNKVYIDRKLFEVIESSSIEMRYGVVNKPAVVSYSDNKTQVIKKGVLKAVEE